MVAVFKHELRMYFQSLTAYVFGAFLLVIVGIGAMLYNLQAAVSNFEYVLSFGSIILRHYRSHPDHAGHRRGAPPENRPAALLPAHLHGAGHSGQIPCPSDRVCPAAVHHRRLSG